MLVLLLAATAAPAAAATAAASPRASCHVQHDVPSSTMLLPTESGPGINFFTFAHVFCFPSPVSGGVSSPALCLCLLHPGCFLYFRFVSRARALRMEEFYDPSKGGVEAHIDAAGFELVSLELPNWYINPDIKVSFTSRASWDSNVRSAPLEVASEMATVLSSTTPPDLDFFRQLPKPTQSRQSKQWAVYAGILEHPQLPPHLYIGSGTNAEGGVQTRQYTYESGTGCISEFVRALLKQGYTLNFGMLCWTPLPSADLVPRTRARFLSLESVFTIIFCACIKMIMDDLFIPGFFLWSRESVTWKPACTHLSLSESVRADLKLTKEELLAAQECRRKRNVEKTQRYRKRRREEDEEGYLKENLDQHNAWSARNRDRVNEIAASVRTRAKEAQRFRCEVCDHNATSQTHLDDHLRSAAHAEAERNGRKILKPLSAAALNRRASRAAAVANRTYYCKPCDKVCTSSTDLKRHNSKKKHKDRVAASEQQ